ncbi:MAG TPA: hypothetical protein VFQ52_03730, partial [Rhizomicrobium sp.]|nr:hypothetical protein [Rhizomicrobium sp.]
MATPDSNRMTIGTWALLALLGLIWGGSFFFARVAIPYVPPFSLVFCRLAIAATGLHLYLRGRFGLYATLASRWKAFFV